MPVQTNALGLNRLIKIGILSKEKDKDSTRANTDRALKNLEKRDKIEKALGPEMVHEKDPIFELTDSIFESENSLIKEHLTFILEKQRKAFKKDLNIIRNLMKKYSKETLYKGELCEKDKAVALSEQVSEEKTMEEIEAEIKQFRTLCNLDEYNPKHSRIFGPASGPMCKIWDYEDFKGRAYHEHYNFIRFSYIKLSEDLKT